MRQILARLLLSPALLLGLVLVAAIWHPGTVRDPWGSCPVDPTQAAPGSACYQPASQPSDPVQGLTGAAEAAVAGRGHQCLPVGQWPHGVIPGGAVMRTGTIYAWEPFAVAWGMTRTGAWTIDLCQH